MHWEPFFQCPGSIRVDLHRGAVQGNRLNPDSQYLLPLQGLEDPLQDSVPGPAVHAGIDRVSVAEPCRQSPPLAAVFGSIEYGVERLQVGEADAATLHWQAVGDALVLFFRNLHSPIMILCYIV